MPRERYQRGSLEKQVPGRRKLPRGTYWGRWYVWMRGVDGVEKRHERKKIITLDVAKKYNIVPMDDKGPLTEANAQRVLDLLIAQTTGLYVLPDKAVTVASVAEEYLALAEPNWGPHTVRGSGNLVRNHIIRGELGNCRITDLQEPDLQRWINKFVNEGKSKSFCAKLILYVRAVWKHARKRKIMTENPTEDLRAKSRQEVCERNLSIDECQRLLGAFVGRDHLIVRIFIQLALRPSELFGLRREDVQGDMLRIDRAIVAGRPAPTKSRASAAMVYLPPELGEELRMWMECSEGEPHDWIFPSERRSPLESKNYLNRILHAGAKRAGVANVTFQALRRTCATLFGAVSKDPKSTQAQMRHADPGITLRVYQKSVPASVQAAAVGLESLLRIEATAKSEVM